jgi:hypothetical protein
MERHKRHLNIAQYSVSDTSLEEIFNSMAAGQEEEHIPISIMAAGGEYQQLNHSSVQAVRSYHRNSSFLSNDSTPMLDPLRQQRTSSSFMSSALRSSFMSYEPPSRRQKSRTDSYTSYESHRRQNSFVSEHRKPRG